MKFIRFSLQLLVLLFSISIHLQAQVQSIDSTMPIHDHPRILMFGGEEAAIRQTISTDTVWRNVHHVIISASDSLLVKEPIKRIQIGRRLLDKSREAIRRLFYLSYAYRTTNDKKYLLRAEKELLTISAFSDWNPSHFLDVAEMTLAVSIGYDWLYNELSPSSREIIREAILKKGLEPSLNSKYNGWLTVEHNWNQVCNAGMTYGAMAIYESQPELARKIINRAIGAIVLPMKDYAPDGIYPEGYGYWGYGTSFNVLFISAVEKLFGSDFGLNAMPGFLQTTGFLEGMTGPSGKPFNYSDAGSNGGFHPAMFWLSKKINDPSVLWEEKRYLLRNSPQALVDDRLLPAALLWNGGVTMDKITAPASTFWTGNGKNPMVLMRTSWTDSNALYVAMKGGSVSINHAHMDVGSFIMEADGVRWAMDFGMQDYESLESKGIQLFGRTQDAQRWTVFRLTNLVHNTLAINNKHQLVTGTAPITKSGNNPSFMFAVTDLSQIYNNQVAKSIRGIAIVDQNHVVVRDEIETLDTITTIRWTMLTPASAKIVGENQIELTKNGKTLMLQVKAAGKIEMKTWSTDPPHDYDAPNPGTTLVGFEITLPANTKTALNVSLLPGKTSTKKLKDILPLDKWGQ